MKKIITTILTLTTVCLYAQQFSEKINKEFTFEKKSNANAVMVANLNGSVRVTGYDGDKVVLEVTKTIIGKTDARLEQGKTAVQLGVIDRADTLIFYAIDGCNDFSRRKGEGRNNWSRKNGWGYSSDGPRGCRTPFDYRLDFVLKIPADVHVIASTINEGDIEVENVKGVVEADNINGSIKLTNLVREAEASTINGDLDVVYSVNPPKDCRFYTLNGDINALFQPGLSARLSFESFNGSFYTNLDNLKLLPASLETSARGEGIRYKVSGNRYQIRNGGAYLDFETFNGNVYLKEKTN